MRILFIAPLPPPVNGHSVVSRYLLDYLRRSHDVTTVDIRKRSLKDGIDSAGRIVEVLGILRQVFHKRRHVDVVYLTIAESLSGNLRDLIVCLLCWRLRSTTYIHLHGGSLRKLLYDRHRSVYWLNRTIIGKLAGAIVSGPSHLQIFDGVLDPARVHIAANFAEDRLFVSEPEVEDAFDTCAPIRILYISHMTEKKGYRRLTEAFLQARAPVRDAVSIDFAGAFENEETKAAFLNLIEGEAHLRYHGVVDDETKRSMFARAHVLCLPTSFLEGQPISVLEAYASGCVVLTTGQPGIRDVFADGVNGYELSGDTPDDIGRGLARIVAGRGELCAIAMRNRRLAEEQYRPSRSLARMSAILQEASVSTAAARGA